MRKRRRMLGHVLCSANVVPSIAHSKGPRWKMADSMIVTLRLPKTLVERADALIPRLREDNQMIVVGRVSRSIVLRLAVLKGLEALEQESPEGPPPQAKAKPAKKKRK